MKVKKFLNFLIVLVVLIVAVILGISYRNINYKNLSNKGDEKPTEDNSLTERSEGLREIIEAINKNSKAYGDKIAVYYYNFNTDESYALNEDKEFVSASLKKIPLVMQVLDKVQANELTLDTKIEYESGDFADGTGILQFEERVGSRTIRELVELSIIESDNIAYKMLNRVCGKTLVEYTEKIVGEDINKADYINFSAKQVAKMLERLYKNPENNPNYQLVIDFMKNTAFHDRLDKYVSEDKVAHKIGSYFRYYHDAGIIYGKENYILVVLTKDIGILSDDAKFAEDEAERNLVDWGERANEVIATISKDVYDIVQR